MLEEVQHCMASCKRHVNNIHIRDVGISPQWTTTNGHVAPRNDRAAMLITPGNGAVTHSCPQQMIMRNPKLFYEAAFIARPKLKDALNLRNSRARQQQINQPTINSSSSAKVTLAAYSPPSSTGTGPTGSGVSTPDSLKGNLRKDISVDRNRVEKKRVQFDLTKMAGCGNGMILGDESEDEAEEDFDDVEKSLMQGYSEYSSLTANGQQQRKKKPDLRIDFGLLSPRSPTTTTATKGEAIDAELPLDQQTWYFGGISRQEAEEILRNRTEGCYIVRACELAIRKDFSLAIKSSCGFMHLRIHRQPDDLYRLADFNRVFFTVPDLIEYYSSERLPIRGASTTMLLHPVHQQLL